MKIKVSEASGPVLDWMVRYAQNGRPPIDYVPNRDNFSTCWNKGGPILTRERISRTIDHSGLWIAYWTDGYTDGDEGKLWMQCNSSELVAGLRCYVASKLGDEVEFPDELCGG